MTTPDEAPTEVGGMMAQSFTASQVDKARHALGLDREKVAYRNYYSCDPDPDWDDLVSRGFAVRRASPVSEDVLYHLTETAKFYFLNSGERVDPELRFPKTPPPSAR